MVFNQKKIVFILLPLLLIGVGGLIVMQWSNSTPAVESMGNGEAAHISDDRVEVVSTVQVENTPYEELDDGTDKLDTYTACLEFYSEQYPESFQEENISDQWRLYEMEPFGITFLYPPTFIVHTYEPQAGYFVLPIDTLCTSEGGELKIFVSYDELTASKFVPGRQFSTGEDSNASQVSHVTFPIDSLTVGASCSNYANDATDVELTLYLCSEIVSTIKLKENPQE